MRTIVEYSAEKPPENAYPERIVSPPHPSPCCLFQMVPVGERDRENGWPFIYKRCTICGFTVRHFESVSPSFLPLQLLTGRWLLHKGGLRKSNGGGKRVRVNVRGGKEVREMMTDPVCGMEVDPKKAPTLVYEGKTFAFCSPACKETFEKSPSKYAEKKAGGHSHGC